VNLRAQWFSVALIVVALVALLVIGATVGAGRGPVSVGSEAPYFEAVNVATGDTVVLQDYQGKVVLLNIWATWCKPCEEEMPSMQRLYEALGPSGLEIVAVSIDRSDSEMVRDWVQERGLTFDVLHDPEGRIERTYQTTGVPESFVIDQNGVLVKRQIGAYEWDQPTITVIFRQLLRTDSLTP
jgi:peroxiredoxin